MCLIDVSPGTTRDGVETPFAASEPFLPPAERASPGLAIANCNGSGARRIGATEAAWPRRSDRVGVKGVFVCFLLVAAASCDGGNKNGGGGGSGGAGTTGAAGTTGVAGTLGVAGVTGAAGATGSPVILNLATNITAMTPTDSLVVTAVVTH